jgi:hypothetical protein
MSTTIIAGFSKKNHQQKQGANKHFNLAQLLTCRVFSIRIGGSIAIGINGRHRHYDLLVLYRHVHDTRQNFSTETLTQEIFTKTLFMITLG